MPTRADSIRSDPLSRFYPIFPSISPSDALQSHLSKKSKLKAWHMVLESSLKRERKSDTTG